MQTYVLAIISSVDIGVGSIVAEVLHCAHRLQVQGLVSVYNHLLFFFGIDISAILSR